MKVVETQKNGFTLQGKDSCLLLTEVLEALGPSPGEYLGHDTQTVVDEKGEVVAQITILCASCLEKAGLPGTEELIKFQWLNDARIEEE